MTQVPSSGALHLQRRETGQAAPDVGATAWADAWVERRQIRLLWYGWLR